MPSTSLKLRASMIRPCLVFLMCVGIAARVFAAWALMESSSSDHGVPCLMAKHIAEGKGFPAFYYGQPYMGSLEPAMGALLTRVFGMNGFAVNLGTALFGIALLPIVYAWGRRAGGAVAGLSALLLLVIGPFGFFQFQSWSYGGYAAIVFFCALVVFGAAWLVARERSEQLPTRWWYLGFGFVAGAAWWTAPHTLPAILTAAVLLLSGIRWKLMGWRALLGLVGFIAGSLPFWLWNVRHDWATFAFLSSGSGGDAWDGVRVFFGTNMLRVLGLPPHPFVWAAYAAFAVLFLMLLIREIRPRFTERGLFLVSLLLYLLVASLLAGGSRYSGPSAPERYLLHVIPFISVALGCVVQFLSRRLPWGLGLVPVILLFALHLRALPVVIGWGSSDREHRQELAELAALLQSNDVQNIYAPYPMRRDGYALNFLLKEQFTFSDPRAERYPPYRRKLELADSVTVMNNLHGVAQFLAASGGSARRCHMAGVTLHYDLAPPPHGLVDISASLRNVVDRDGASVLAVLTDAEATTCWPNCPNDGHGDWLEFRWDSAQPVHALQLYSAANLYAHDLRMEWLSADGRWIAADRTLPEFSGYFWSGRRVYLWGDLYRQEFRFGPFVTTAVRLHVNTEDQRSCILTEARVFAQGEADAADAVAVISAIRDLGLTSIYADRWMANRIHEGLSGEVATTTHPNALGDPARRLSSNVRWTPKTGMVVPSTMIASCDASLAAAGFVMSQREVGGRRLYYFDESDWLPHYATNTSFIWTGVGCIKRSDRRWAAYLDKHADVVYQAGHLPDACDVLEEAVSIFPGLPGGMQRLATWLEQADNADAAARWRRKDEAYRTHMQPTHLLPVQFGDEIHFEGVTISHEKIPRGGSFGIHYFWRCTPSVVPTDWAVFVHFVGEDGSIAFQDDHVFLKHESAIDQPVSVMFREQRQVTVPRGLAPGQYRIRFGVYGRAATSERMVPQTEFPHVKSRVSLPVTLAVTDR